MRDLVIYGSGGFGREVLNMVEDINSNELEWNILGFINDYVEFHGEIINGHNVLGGIEYLKGFTEERDISVVVAIGSSKERKKIVDKLSYIDNLNFPSIIHPSVVMSKYVNVGKGTIICAGNILTCNISLGDFVVLNLASTVGHDVNIRDFATVLPGCNISGNVIINRCAEIGSNSTIIPHIQVGENTIVGAGATVVRDLPNDCTAVGCPAKPIKFN